MANIHYLRDSTISFIPVLSSPSTSTSANAGIHTKSTECNGKQCYEVKGSLSTALLTEKGSKVYIEKDTGLYVKAIGDNMMMEREYEFDNVDDSIFVEPDVSQYSLDE